MENSKIKSGYVAIIGRPNVGKSTLMNRIIGQKIAITSNKPQTTRNKIQTVYTDERGQIVFLDTPGINKAKNKLGDFMVSSALRAVEDADLIMWLVEPSNFIGKGEQYIIELLKKSKQPVILTMNKVDSVDKDKVLEFIDTYRKAYDFDEIVPISAKEGDNVDTLVEQIFKYLPYGPMFYDEDTLTDQPLKQIVAEIIREKSLYCLDEEVPHGIAVVIERYHERTRHIRTLAGTDRGENNIEDTIVDIEATIICEKESHKSIIIGKQGAMLKKIGTISRHDIERLVEARVNLKLWVKVRKEWRDSDAWLRNFGYSDKNIK